MRPSAAKTFGVSISVEVCVRSAIFWGFAVLALSVVDAGAQYRVDSWTSDDGLPQNSVNAIVQTRDGYLWFATFDGLARFDGVRFTVFDKSNSPGIESNRIISIFEDDHGALWIGSEAGYVTRFSQGRFTSYAQQQGLPMTAVYNISGDEDGNLYVLCGTGPMRLVDGRFVPALPPDARAPFGGANVGADSRGVSAFDERSLHRFSRGRLSTYTVADGLPSLRIHGIDEDQYGSTWVLTEDAGLARIEHDRVVRVYTRRDGLPAVRPRTSHTIERLVVCKDRKGNIWIAGAGPWLGCLRDGVFTTYPSPSPSGEPVRAIFEDLEENIWVGTDGGGVLRLREPIVTVYPTTQGLQAGNIYPVCEDRTGAVWVGAWGTGLSRFKDGVVTNYSVVDGLPNPLVSALYEDRDGRLWVGTFGGLRYFDGGRLMPAAAPLGAPGYVVSAIHQDREGVFWFGSDRGLLRVDGATATVFTTNDGLASDDVKVIVEDRSGALWVGTDGGLTRVEGGRFMTWTEAGGHPIGNVRALYADDDDVLWIGTYDSGLARLEGGAFTRVTTKEGLFDNGAFQILEDGRGALWMSSNRGIYRVDKRQLNDLAGGRLKAITSIPYGKGDGMRNVECNGGRSPAGAKTRDGRLWFPTQDGVAVIDPATVNVNPRPPPVVIEACLVDRERVAFDGVVRIESGAENFEIQYTALSFVNSGRLEFRYKLVGLDHDWVEAGVRRTAYYSHLPPGEYTFTVLAANSDGIWNTAGASVTLVVVPPFWRTWWFSALALLGVASAAVMWHARRLARLRREHAAQADFSRRLMESQEGERKRIAAELHDSLGQSLAIIKNRALLGLQRVDDNGYALERLREISEASAEAIDEVKEIAQNLRPYQLDRLGLTRTIEAMLVKVADTHGLRVASEIDRVDGLLAPAAETNVFRIVQEGVNNVVAHAGATGVDVLVKRRPRAVEVTVRDDGKGFVPGASNGDGPSRGGFGLTGMAERARQIGGELRLRSAPGRGTTLTLTVRVKEARDEGRNES